MHSAGSQSSQPEETSAVFNLLQEEKGETNGVLGLRLRKSSSLINLIETRLVQERQPKQMNEYYSQRMADKLKASNFSATLLKIGSWERRSMHEGDLVAKLYYAKKKLVWEVLEKALKSKIEIQWSDISAIRAIIRDKEPGILEIELNHPPQYFRETNPQPRKHTLWQHADDFTGGQAPICRRHRVIFPPGILDKHYQKLLQCDKQLFMLSQRPFPSHNYPYFVEELHLEGHSNSNSPRPGNWNFPLSNFPHQHVFHPHFQHFKQTTTPLLGVMSSDSPMSVMSFPHLDERANSYPFENQRTAFQGGSINCTMATQGSSFLGGQGYHPIMPNQYPSRGLELADIEKHLLGEPQQMLSRRVNSSIDTLFPAQPGLGEENTGSEAHNHQLGVNSSKPVAWLPAHQDSGENMNMMVDAEQLFSFPSQPTMEKFPPPDNQQDCSFWNL